jgi:hypothetical protein
MVKPFVSPVDQSDSPSFPGSTHHGLTTSKGTWNPLKDDSKLKGIVWLSDRASADVRAVISGLQQAAANGSAPAARELRSYLSEYAAPSDQGVAGWQSRL